MTAWNSLSASWLTWVFVTLLAYRAASGMYGRSGANPLANPVLLSVTMIAGVLWLTGTSYEEYFAGAQMLHALIGPATVALAIPLYSEVGRLRTMLVPMTIAVLVGSLTASGSALAIGWVFGASAETLLSLAPKSTTMPIAMGIAERIGGLPSLTTLTVTLTGISGAIMARGVLRLVGSDDPAVQGFAIGTTAHAIGTAHALQTSEVAGAFAALAMGLNGVTTAVLLPIMIRVIGGR